MPGPTSTRLLVGGARGEMERPGTSVVVAAQPFVEKRALLGVAAGGSHVAAGARSEHGGWVACGAGHFVHLRWKIRGSGTCAASHLELPVGAAAGEGARARPPACSGPPRSLGCWRPRPRGGLLSVSGRATGGLQPEPGVLVAAVLARSRYRQKARNMEPPDCQAGCALAA